MAYSPMSDDERLAFLREPVRPAILSTVRKDGSPHAAPVWYALDGDVITFTTGQDTVKGRNLRRDPRLALCVQDDQPPFSFVAVQGVAQLSGDLDQVSYWAAIIGGRYMGAERAEEYGKRNGVPGELLVQVTPARWAAAKAVAD